MEDDIKKRKEAAGAPYAPPDKQGNRPEFQYAEQAKEGALDADE